MVFTVLFLITCVMTARLLEKKKMYVASVMYSVMFVILLTALLFTSDIELVNRSLSNLIGIKTFLQTKEILLYAFESAGYGLCILIALLFTFILQFSLSVICTVVTIVRFLKKGREVILTKKEKYGYLYIPRAFYVHKPINLLYCRMLN